MKSRHITLFTLFVLIVPLLIQPILITPAILSTNHLNALSSSSGISTPNSANSSPAFPNGPVPPSPGWSGLGDNQPVIESAEGINSYQYVDLISNPNASIDLPEYWQGNYIEIAVFYLQDQQEWISDGGFPTGSGGSSGSWVYDEDDRATSNIAGSWVSSGPSGAGACVYVEMTMGGGSATFATGEYGRWSSSFQVPRGSVTSARLNFDFFPNDVIERSEFETFVEIEGTDVWVRHMKYFRDNGFDEQWNHANISIGDPWNIFDLINDPQVTMRFGIRFASGGATYTGWSDINRMYFDNMSLSIQAETRPEYHELQLRDTQGIVHDVNNTSPTAWGVGQVNFSTTVGPAPPPLYATYDFEFLSNITSPQSGSLVCNSTVQATLATETDVASYDAENAVPINWSLVYDPYMDVYNQPVGDGPTKYTRDYFNLTIPLDWTISAVLDVNSVNRSGPGEYEIYPLGARNVVVVNVTLIDIYYPYTIIATSMNYVLDIDIFDASSPGTPDSEFRAGDTPRVNATISDDPDGVYSGNATLTILAPDLTVWYTEVKEVNAVNQGQITFDGIPSLLGTGQVGVFEVTVSWDNSTVTSGATEVGGNIDAFTVTHATSLSRYGMGSNVPVFLGEEAIIRVRFVDTDANQGVWSADTAVWNISEVTWTISGSFIDYGGGIYVGEINTTTAPDYGAYSCTVTLNKSYYDPQIQLPLFTIEITKHTTLDSPQAPRVSVPFGEDILIELTYNDTSSIPAVPIDNTAPDIQVTCDWDTISGGTYTGPTYSSGKGMWEFTLHTTGIPVNSYDVTFTANATGYEWQQIKIEVNVRKHATDLVVYPPAATPWNENTSIEIYLTDADLSIPITGNVSQITIQTSQGTFIYDSSNWAQYVTNGSAGIYFINVTTDGWSIGAYNDNLVSVTMGAWHLPVSRTVDITVRQLNTILTYEPPQNTPWGNDVNINLFYTVFDAASHHNGEGILPAVDVTVDSLTGGWTLDPSDYGVVHLGFGQYLLTIDASAFPAIQSYSIQVFISETSTGRYADAQTPAIGFAIRTTFTELTYTPPDPVAWASNSSIIVLYRINDDLSSQNGDPILGAPFEVLGVGWTLPGTNYWVKELGSGYYQILVDTSAVTGPGAWSVNISINWPASPPIYQERYVIPTMTVTTRATIVSISYGTNVDYGSNITVNLYYIDVATDSNVDNVTEGPYVRITVYNTTSGLLLSDAIHWIFGPGPLFTIEINTSAFANVNTFHSFTINASWVAGNPPFYDSAVAIATVYVVGTKTTVTYIPPEPQPIGDDLIFIIYYNATDTGLPIDNSSGYVGLVASCVNYPALTLIYTVQEINGGLDGYRLIISTSNFPNLGQYTFRVNVTWPINQEPFYASQSILMGGYVRAIHTSLTWELPGALYWGDNLVFLVTYYDVDHSIALYDLTNTTITTWISWAGWSVLQILPNGTYQIQVPTSSENVGLASFTIRFSSNFYETRQQLVQITINPLPQFVSILSTSPWTTEYAGEVVVTVQILDIYGRRINDSTVTYHWGGFPSAPMVFLGNGIYNVSFAANHDVGTWIVSVESVKTNCQTGIGSVTLYILPTDTILTLLTPTIITVVGSSFVISANFSTADGNPIITATLLYVWAGGNGSLTHVGQGIYNATIDSLGLELGQFSLYVTASSPNAIERFNIVNVFLVVIPTDLSPTDTVIAEYWGTNFTINVYFNDTFHNTPITGANVTYFWGTLIGQMQETGPPGWYTITLPTTIFAAGATYEVVCASDVPTYEFGICVVTVNILAQISDLELSAAGIYYEPLDVYTTLNLTGWTVPRSDILFLYFNYTDSNGNPITGAFGSYNWLYGSGVLTYNAGLYYAAINMNETSPGYYFIDITLSRQNYQTAQILNLPVTVTLVRTELRGLPNNLLAITGTAYTFSCTLWDLDHNIPITNAIVTVEIPGITPPLGAELTNLGNGTYVLAGISFPIETAYVVQFTAETGLVYAVATHQMNIQVDLHPLVENTLRIGLLGAIIGIIILIAWLAYTRVFAIPWLVRKMRKMSNTLGKGGTTHLSNRDINRIATRPESMETIIEPAYGAIGLPTGATVLPAAITIEEREAEDEIIWTELEKLEGLGHDQKLELFEEMKRIPAKDRVWFIEDLKEQMADGTRFGRIPAEPTPVPEGVDPFIHARLQSLDALGDEEKAAVVEQLRGLSKEEQEEVIKALEETTRKSD
ncbi:MAG: hypothetical protein ACFFCH_04455 [Promethearchaeota archaeon]